MGEFNVNKSDGSLEQTAGMPSEYPATQVMMPDGVTSVVEKIGNMRMGKLWENPNPTSAMASGTAISLSSSDYDCLMAVYRYSKSVETAKSVILPKGSRFLLDFASTSSNGCDIYRRNLNYISDTSYTVSSAYEAHGATATTVNNDYVIPIAIYGITLT